jgi:hypothetical protein
VRAALLGVAWGVLVLVPLMSVPHRVAIRSRLRAIDVAPRPARRPRRRRRAPQAVAVVRRVVGAPVRAREARRHSERLVAELPVAVDLVGVAVGAGCTPFQAVEVGARWSPPLVAAVLDRIRRTAHVGAGLDEALRMAGAESPAVRGLTEILRVSARLGNPAAPALARLAHEVRGDVRRRAESHARTVPVRLLFPLVFCILPAFALLTVVPVMFDQGLVPA